MVRLDRVLGRAGGRRALVRRTRAKGRGRRARGARTPRDLARGGCACAAVARRRRRPALARPRVAAARRRSRARGPRRRSPPRWRGRGWCRRPAGRALAEVGGPGWALRLALSRGRWGRLDDGGGLCELGVEGRGAGVGVGRGVCALEARAGRVGRRVQCRDERVRGGGCERSREGGRRWMREAGRRLHRDVPLVGVLRYSENPRRERWCARTTEPPSRGRR